MKINLVLDHIIKILLVSLLCIMLLIGSIFVIPPKFAFADTEPLVSIPILTDDLNDIKNNGLFAYSYRNQNVYLASIGPEYSCCYVQPATVSGATADLIFFSSTDSFPDLRSVYYSGSSWQKSTFTLNPVQESDGLYYSLFGATGSINPDIPVYESLEDALSSASGGSGGSPEPKQAIVTIEPGYVAYIGITGGHAFFTATFNKKQPKGSISNNIRYGFSSSRPAESSTITMDSSVGSVLPLVTDRPYDIWGKSFNGRYGIDDLSASYLIVYVPLTDPDGNTNATVKVALSEYLNSVQFPLSASMVGGDIVSTGDSDIFYISDSSMLTEDFRPEYVYSNEGSTSSAISIPVGGNNLPPTTGGGSLIEQFTTLLSDLINRIESLLIAPVEYIKWIISSSSNFMSWLSAIWTWLPEPVYTTIVSVLLILVVVGALKLLWR